jgi:hypothetical protein
MKLVCIPFLIFLANEFDLTAPTEKGSVSDASTLPRVSVHRYKLTDAEEKDMDKDVFDSFEGTTKPKSPTLLALITREDKRLVPLAISAARELLQSYPAIEGMLQVAWNAGGFKEIRKLGAIFCSYIVVGFSMPRRNSVARRNFEDPS